MRILPRLLGAITAAYGMAITVRPALLARPCGLPDSPANRTLIGGIGMRDVAIGGAMVLAPRVTALRSAVLARVIADTSDALVFGTRLPAADRRWPIARFALGWAAACALSGRWATR